MTYKTNMLAAAAAAMIAIGATPATAGEVTGNDAGQVDANGRSICKFSGLNDGDAPAGHTQSYGQDVRAGREDPTDFDPDDLFSMHPGWFCDPNNFDARENLPR